MPAHPAVSLHRAHTCPTLTTNTTRHTLAERLPGCCPFGRAAEGPAAVLTQPSACRARSSPARSPVATAPMQRRVMGWDQFQRRYAARSRCCRWPLVHPHIAPASPSLDARATKVKYHGHQPSWKLAETRGRLQKSVVVSGFTELSAAGSSDATALRHANVKTDGDGDDSASAPRSHKKCNNASVMWSAMPGISFRGQPIIKKSRQCKNPWLPRI